MNTKRWIALVIAGVVLVVSLGFQAVWSFLFSDFAGSFEDILAVEAGGFEPVVREQGDLSSQIAVLTVEGVIQDTGSSSSFIGSEGYRHQDFLRQIEAVKEDPTIKGVVLRVNSPGGGVVESAELHQEIVELTEEKPVYVSMGATAASGGYYISAPAQKIFASKETMTGSLGVIMQSINVSELADRFGVEMITVASGPYKDMLNPTKEVSEEERAILSSMVENSYNAFVEVIQNGREMSEEKVRTLADGRIYDGIQAKENGLIDEFGYLDDVIEAMKVDEDLEGAQVVEYRTTSSIGSLFSAQVGSLFGSGFSEVGMLERILQRSGGPRLMYLYTE
ncbi:signal peptide peptidase SppA [Bacillus fonticola]|uniref:signal peptide peptidase SppA n=1 Tax=Bacillus fonticola TaxID=2728853 RepID=UPI00147472A1|nr:signal peptide peptidase SppA [Bacillus fonticola]